MIITIEEFGKIKHARINLGDYNIFVGENNSGKTFTMQLIYGILEFLTSEIGFNNLNKDIIELIDLSDEFPVEITESNYRVIENYINECLDKNKEMIVNNIFKKDIPLKKIRVELNNFNSTYTVKQITPSEMYEKFDEKSTEKLSQAICFSVNSNTKTIAKYGIHSQTLQHSKNYIADIIRVILCDYLQMRKLARNSENVFFLPASRSGLMLVYKHFFEKEKKKDNIIIDNLEQDYYSENEYGLTKPVYDFMSFLQTYETSEPKTKENIELINFINENLIKGSLRRSGNSMLYTPNNSDIMVPAYLSSSMINEISPVMQLLTSINNYKYIFYDEIETCQHPLTQIQMSRLLVRMVNAGYKMIVSTHSDTMAAAINNTIMLSFTSNKEEKAIKIGYNSNDFLNTQNIHAYHFVNTESGTVVEELENYLDMGIGFNFDSFSQSNKKIFYDAQIILEDN